MFLIPDSLACACSGMVLPPPLRDCFVARSLDAEGDRNYSHQLASEEMQGPRARGAPIPQTRSHDPQTQGIFPLHFQVTIEVIYVDTVQR